MDVKLIGSQIAKFRKAAGQTQEELGKAVGVSTQAVSRWECGGAPDVSLLPAIADALHVTVDALFGRSADKVEDMFQTLIRWLDNAPDGERLGRMFELLAASYPHLVYMDAVIADVIQPMAAVLPSCYTADGTWLRSGLSMDQGYALGVFSRDLPLYLLLPEPSAGYASQFAAPGKYRALFSVLSREGTLELLYYLYGREYAYYTVSALADRVGLASEQARSILADMDRCSLVSKTTIETRAGSEPVYAKADNGGLVPFLYMARWFMERDKGWYMQWNVREKPTLLPAEPAAPRTE